MTTKAIVLSKYGPASQSFELQEMELPPLAADEVRIESEAFGLNYADVMARLGLYREAPPLPCVLGYELVGKVVQVGDDSHHDLLGKRVLAFSRFGAYAKTVYTKANAVVPIEDIPAEKAMALSTQGVTAYYMANYLAPIHKGEHVLIHAAAGGVGSILIQLAKEKGAIVHAKIGSESKRDLIHHLGADYVLNYKEKAYEFELEKSLNGKQLSVSFNPVAGNTIKKDMKLLGPNGRLVLFGASQMTQGKWGIFSKLKFLFNMGFMLPIGLMMQSKSVLGVNMLKIADDCPEIISVCLSEIVKKYREGGIQIHVGGVYKVEQIEKAHNLLESGQSMGKITIQW